jgi:N-carbamoylputrescine amidase
MAADVRELRVAAVQMESQNGAIEANLECATRFADEAAGRGARLVVFPEFMPTGYVFTREIWDAGEPSDGPTMAWLREHSARLGIYLGTSFLEAVGDEFFNTFMLTGPDGGVAGSVRKQTPAAAEAYFFRGEKGSHIIETELGTIGVGICYENQLAFTPGLMCGQSVDIMLMPHSAPAPTPVWWLPGKRREAIAEILRKLPVYYANILGVPVVYVNKTGPFKSRSRDCPSTPRTPTSRGSRRSPTRTGPYWRGSAQTRGSPSPTSTSTPHARRDPRPGATGAGPWRSPSSCTVSSPPRSPGGSGIP